MTSCVIRCGAQRSWGPLMYIVIGTHKKPYSGFPGLCVCVCMHTFTCVMHVHVLYMCDAYAMVCSEVRDNVKC